MKLLLVAAFLVVCLSIGEAKRCRSEEDCKDDECCIMKGFTGIRRGKCQKLAQKGQRCSEEMEVVGFFDKHYNKHCPCAAGLSCEPTEIKDIPFIGTVKIDERCITDISVTTPAKPETDEPETESPEPETEPPQPETEEPETEPPQPETEEPETEEPEPETEEPETEEPEPEPETEEPETEEPEPEEPEPEEPEPEEPEPEQEE